MKFNKVVDNIGTITELKRIASAYVIDYRALSEEKIRAALKKTAPQYYYPDNVHASLKSVLHGDDRAERIISRLLLLAVLINQDDFMAPKRDAEDAVVAWQQSVIDHSNEDLIKSNSERKDSVDLFQFVVETAWANNDNVSRDEANLIEKLRIRLKITDAEYRIIEAKLSKFPTPGNRVHSRDDIERVRRTLHSKGLLFAIRDSDGKDFDIIPDEVAGTIRDICGFEIRRHGYQELIASKYVRSKQYLSEVLKKLSLTVDKYAKLEELQALALEHVKPSILLGGLTPKDGLQISDLKKWCNDLGIPVSGTKPDLIERIVNYYDQIRERDESTDDPRSHFLQYYEWLASRNRDQLRMQKVIDKDIEIERKFEEATDYLFEIHLGHRPLNLVGSNHADGALSYQDKVIYWDNKSKETAVDLHDHIKQFDGYIRESDKPVAGFLVIAPEFTDRSRILAMQYQVQNSVPIGLITASELKMVAELWGKKRDANIETKFPLGYLIQPGRFDMALVEAI